MAGGVGIVRYPQVPPRTAPEMGAAAEQEALQAQMARGRPGYLPYKGVGGVLPGASVPAPEEAQAISASPQMPSPSMGIGAALLARKQRHADHLASLGVMDDAMGGSSGY